MSFCFVEDPRSLMNSLMFSNSWSLDQTFRCDKVRWSVNVCDDVINGIRQNAMLNLDLGPKIASCAFCSS